jgi:glycosyltransferase involved in cell wall biosynthesis
VEEILRPALDRGEIVLCDRYGDASTAYQGVGRGLGIERVEEFNDLATGRLSPDLTFLVDLDPREGQVRMGRRKRDRMEQEDAEFHRKVREGYLELARRHPRVRVIHHPHNRGYGAALRTGFENAAQELVFYTDCDEPVDLWEIERALALIGPQVDIVVGYRVKRYDTLRRFVYSKIYNALCRLLFRIPVRDVNFSFKLVKREVLQRINLRAGSVFIDGELLAEAVRYGYRIVEIHIEYFPRRDGTSNFDSLHAAFYTLQEMLTYWWRSRTRARTPSASPRCWSAPTPWT